MSKTIVTIAVLLVAVMALSVGAQDVDKIKIPPLHKINIPDVEKVTLDNGMRLYLLQDKSLPLFNINVRLNTGTYLDPPDKVGLAEMTGSVMRTGGTAKHSGDEIDEILEGIGGTVETGISDVQGSAFVNVLSDYTDTGLDILAEVLRTPRFDQDKIDLAKVQARSAISRRNDDVGSIALREYRKLIYGAESPYARTEEYATVDAITRDDLVKFHDEYIRPENVQMAIWGDFDRDALLTKIKGLFGDWQRGTVEVPPPPPVDYKWRSKVYYAQKTDAAKAYIRIGHIGGLMTDPDYADKIVMNSILGGGFGSRLTNEVRTKLGLAYSAGGRYISNLAYPGYFFSVASTDNGNTVKAARAMLEQIRSMLTVPPTEEEMQKGKDGYLNSFVFNFDSRREVVGRMMTYDFYGLPEDFLEQEKQGVEKVTAEDVMAAARRNLHPDSMIILVAGNADAFDMPLDSLGLGPAEVIDITIPRPESDAAELEINDNTLSQGRAVMAAGIEAMGGLDAFKGVKTIAITAQMKLSMRGQEIALPYTSWREFPDKDKSEINFMGRSMVDMKIGKRAWRTNQMSGELEELTEEQVAESADEEARATMRLFKAFDDPYYRAVYAGEDNVGGTDSEWVALIGTDDDTECARLGFAKDTHILTAKSYWGKSMNGEGQMVEVYSDYKTFAGVMMPMTSKVTMNGDPVMGFEISEYNINTPLPEDAFAIPE